MNGANIRKVDFRTTARVDAPGTEILNLNGVTLRATCIPFSVPPIPGTFNALGVTASTTGADTDLVSESRVPANTDGTVSGRDDGNANNDDFAASEEVNNGVALVGNFGTGAGDTNNVQLLPSAAPGGQTGTTHFRAADGRGVVVHWTAADFTFPCLFSGYAVGT